VASVRRQHQLPTAPLAIGSQLVHPVRSVRNLGVFIDADLVMRSHVVRVVSRCFGVLRQLRQIRLYVPPSTFQALVVALVLTRLDYANSVLIGLLVHLIRRLQSVLNVAARLIYGLRRCDHITDALLTLHWLKVPEHPVQAGCANPSGSARNCSELPRSPTSDSGFAWAARSPIGVYPSAVCSPVRLSTVGHRAFSVAGPQIWNSLPVDITMIDSLLVFRRRLKTHLFHISCPDVLLELAPSPAA
jgi:hypothetical protein